MDPYTDIANNIQEVQYLLRKMRNEIVCCLKAISTVKTCSRELATAFADKEIDNPTESEVDAVEEADDGDSSLAVITEAGLIQSVTLNFPQEVTFNSLSFDYGAVILKMNERDDLSGSLGPQVFSCDLDSSASFCISGVCQNVYKKLIAPSVTIYHLSDYTDLLWLLNGVSFQLFWKDKPPRPPEIISFRILYDGVSTVSCFIMQTQTGKGATGCLIDSFMRGILAIVSKNIVAPVQRIKFFIWVLDMSGIRQGNAQLLFETHSSNLSIYNFCNSTVCENAPATFHSDSNMLCPLNVSRCTLFDWEYVQLMMAWYLRFSLLWIEENVQRLNVWWLFDLACHSPIRLETETYVLGDLEDVRFVSLNMGSLAAAAKYRGDFVDILRATLKDVEEIDTKLILFIFEVYLVFSAGKTKGLMEAANQLKHMLYRGQLRCTDAISLGEFEQYVEKDTAIGNRSYIAEPSIAVTIRICRGLEVKYDRHQDDKALVMAALLLAQYTVSLYLPNKANGFEDAGCTNVRVPLAGQPEEISNLVRKRIQLEVKVHALAREKDKTSKTHVAGGSFTFKRDASNDNLDKEIKISLFCKQNQLLFLEAKRLQDMVQMHYEFIIIYYHMSMTKLISYYCGKWLDSGQIYKSYSDIGVSHVFTDIYISLSRGPSGTRSSCKEVKQLIELWVQDYWCLVILEENDQWIVNKNNTITDIHRLPSIHISSYIDSFIKGVSTGSIFHSRERLHPSQNLITAVVRNVSQSQGFVILEWKRLDMINLVHWTYVESDNEKKKQEELETKFKGWCKVIKNILGPSPIGVDKTELVKPLTDQLFYDKHILISIDMYEYMEQHSVGHHKESRQFIEVVKRRPYNVILSDEIKRCHQLVFKALLQALNDRRLKEREDLTVDFTIIVIISTSNLDAEHLFVGLFDKVTVQGPTDQVMQDVKMHLRPELLNQLDAIAWNNVLPQSYDPTHGASPIRTCLTLLFKMLLWKDRAKTRTVSLHVDEALKGIPVLFLADFGHFHFYQLQYRELPLHMYGSWEEQLIIQWTDQSPAATTWKRITSIPHEFLIFDLEDKVTFDRGSNVTSLISKQGSTHMKSGRKSGPDHAHKGTTDNKAGAAPAACRSGRATPKSERYCMTEMQSDQQYNLSCSRWHYELNKLYNEE